MASLAQSNQHYAKVSLANNLTNTVNQSTSSPSRPVSPSCPGAPLEPWKFTWKENWIKVTESWLMTSRNVASGILVTVLWASPFLLCQQQFQLIPAVHLFPVGQRMAKNNNINRCIGSSWIKHLSMLPKCHIKANLLKLTKVFLFSSCPKGE